MFCVQTGGQYYWVSLEAGGLTTGPVLRVCLSRDPIRSVVAEPLRCMSIACCSKITTNAEIMDRAIVSDHM